MKRPLGYLDGIGTGLALIGLVALAWLASATEPFAAMYQDLGPRTTLPASTQLVLSTAWRIGVPAVLVAGLVAAHVWRPRHVMLVLAVVTLGVAVFWYLAAYQPIYALAGNISG